MITIIEDDEIELRTKDNNIINNYNIYIKETNELIGYIRYRGYHSHITLGDIGIIIYQKYRQCGYATKALKLLSKHLKENNIENYWITCNKENIPSKTVIEKVTQTLPKQITKDILLYECHAPKKKKQIKNNLQTKKI